MQFDLIHHSDESDEEDNKEMTVQSYEKQHPVDIFWKLQSCPKLEEQLDLFDKKQLQYKQ